MKYIARVRLTFHCGVELEGILRQTGSPIIFKPDGKEMRVMFLDRKDVKEIRRIEPRPEVKKVGRGKSKAKG